MQKLLIVLVSAGLLVSAGTFLYTQKFVKNQETKSFGSTEIGNSYHATTTDTQANFANYRVIREGTDYSSNPTSTPGVLGSIVITKTGTAPMCFYDATSTKNNGEWATTTLACFPASPVVGTYTFDLAVRKGILLEFSDAAGLSRASSTITYRLTQTP